MFSRPTKKHVKCLVSAAAILTIAGLFVAPIASDARLIPLVGQPRVAGLATVTENGRHIIVTGPIACTEGQTAYLRVTVTQRSTGAVAEGLTRITCTADIQQWEVHASKQGKEIFEEGPATAVALARTTDRRHTDDAHQELVDITLAGE